MDAKETSAPMPERPTKLNFTNMTDELKGSIYDVGDGSKTNQFITTKKSITRYAGCTVVRSLLTKV